MMGFCRAGVVSLRTSAFRRITQNSVLPWVRPGSLRGEIRTVVLLEMVGDFPFLRKCVFLL